MDKISNIGQTPPPSRLLPFGTLGLCFLISMSARGLMESFPVFLLPLTQSFEGSRATITGIYSLATLLYGLAAPMAGHLFDRFGPRRLFVSGLLAMGLGLLAASQAQAVWHLQMTLGLGMGLGVALLGNVPNTALVSRWFPAQRSLVSAVIFSSMGIGILILVPLAQLAIAAIGWRGSYLLLGASVLLLLALVAFLPWRRIEAGHPDWQRNNVQSRGERGLWTLRRALRNPAFWGLFAVFFFTSQGMFALTVQIIALLVEQGFAPLLVASLWGFAGLLMPLGMIGFGWLDGRIGRRRSVSLSYLISFAALGFLALILFAPSLPLLILFILCMGSSLGSRGPLVAATALELFHGPHAGAILGAVSMAGGLGAAFGSFWGGWIHDQSGGYGLVIALSALSFLLGWSPFFTIATLRAHTS